VASASVDGPDAAGGGVDEGGIDKPGVDAGGVDAAGPDAARASGRSIETASTRVTESGTSRARRDCRKKKPIVSINFRRPNCPFLSD
jgi:hypothetical protein